MMPFAAARQNEIARRRRLQLERRDLLESPEERVREEAIQLFGFSSSSERHVFQLLLRASRVGPKLAQTVLSGTAESIGMVRQSLQQKIRELELRSEDWSEDAS